MILTDFNTVNKDGIIFLLFLFDRVNYYLTLRLYTVKENLMILMLLKRILEKIKQKSK